MKTSEEIKNDIGKFINMKFPNLLAQYFISHLPSTEETLKETNSYLYRFSEAVREWGNHSDITPDYPFEMYAEYMIFANDVLDTPISYKKLCAFMQYNKFNLDKWHKKKHCEYVIETINALVSNYEHKIKKQEGI